MKPFLDLTGASGATYRFRLIADLADLPVMAGAFVGVRADPDVAVVCCGTARSLLAVRTSWEKLREDRQITDLFVRLNVSRETREFEHEDLVAAVRPPIVLPDLG